MREQCWKQEKAADAPTDQDSGGTTGGPAAAKEINFGTIAPIGWLLRPRLNWKYACLEGRKLRLPTSWHCAKSVPIH